MKQRGEKTDRFREIGPWTVALWLAAASFARCGGVGICHDPDVLCNDPCPAELACYGDGDCPDGYFCPPVWDQPYACRCDLSPGVWTCDDFIFAGRCVLIPEPTGPRGYTIIDLGTLGGSTANAGAINNLGQVVGEADAVTGFRHAFLWENGVMIDLGVLQGDRMSFAADINDYGQVACNSSYEGGFSWDAFLWENGGQIQLGDLAGYGSQAFAMNDAAQIVGWSRIGAKSLRGFLWHEGVMIDLYETFGFSGVRDINSFGEMAFSFTNGSETHAAIWSDGTIADLGTLGGLYSFPVAINDRGEVLGSSERAPGGDRMFTTFFWTDGEMLDIDVPGTLSHSEQDALNNCGESALADLLYHPRAGSRALAYFIPVEAHWYELRARGMNDRGQIVGYGLFEGNYRAFLMSPVPGDLDVDGDIDLCDFAFFQNAWTGVKPPAIPGCERADLDGDADVDGDDLAMFCGALNGPRLVR